MLLPGAVLVEIALRLTPIDGVVTRGGVVAFLASAYVAGGALQGVAAFVFSLRPLRTLSDSGNLRQSEEHAQRILEAKLGEKISRDRVLDLCLSRVQSKREGYDKFIALRDMSRALVLVAIVVAAVVLLQHRHQLFTVRYGAVLLGCVVMALSFLERYRRFAPLARQVVFAQFIAGEMKQEKSRSRSVAKVPKSASSS